MRRCPACEFASARAFGEKNGQAVSLCARCGTLFSDAIAPSAELYDDYYAHNDVPDFMSARLDQIVSRFGAYRKLNRLLDVGFGAGSILDAGQRAGWEVHGVEVSGRAVEDVKKRHPNVLQATLADAKYPGGHFDVVVASELIEHLDDPFHFATEVLRLLRPGGLLWATTPHGRGLAARVLGTQWTVISPSDHLQLFSVSGAHTLFARAGFRRTHIDTHGADPIEMARAIRGKFRRSQPAEPFNRVESLQPLNRVFVQTRSGSAAKTVINTMLNLARLGDSLKIFAET